MPILYKIQYFLLHSTEKDIIFAITNYLKIGKEYERDY